MRKITEQVWYLYTRSMSRYLVPEVEKSVPQNALNFLDLDHMCHIEVVSIFDLENLLRYPHTLEYTDSTAINCQ